MATIPSIPEFYSGRKIFVTGGTGFMGKVLIEKLLRSCPDLHTIYLLIRPKKGKHPQDRIQDITRQALFDTLRRDDPGAFDKLRAVSGDVKELGLGLSVEDKEMLQREVSIVFHSAATVRFTAPLNYSILMNVRGTLEVVNLALGMENLQAFLHLSTAYSNVCDRGHLEEKIYPSPHGWNWKTAIRLAEMEGTDSFVNCLTPKILGQLLPNSYVFTKALGEQVINDHRDRLPMVIVRPSIVVGAFEPPLSGWADNLNGPYAFWAGVYTGIVRSTYCIDSVVTNMVPVDTSVKAMIVIAWHRALSNLSINSELPVYNCTSMLEQKSQGAILPEMGKVARKYPTAKMIWYPSCTYTSSWTWFYLNLVLLHLPYGLLLDAIMKYKNMKPMFGKIYRTLYTTVCVYFGFVCIDYTFDNHEFLRVSDKVLPSDRKAFTYSEVQKLDEDGYTTMVLGGRKHIIRDPIETMPVAKRNLVRLYWLDKIVKGSSYLALLWAITTTRAFHALAALYHG